MHGHPRIARHGRSLVQRVRRVFPLLTLTLLMGFGKAHAVQEPRPHVDMRVAAAGWGNTNVEELRQVLQAVIDEFGRHFPARQLGRLQVMHGDNGPVVLYERAADGAYTVKLSARDGRWFQFVYQFAHELCHIYSNFDNKRDAQGHIVTMNQWFEESICEAASLFTLRQLSQRWALAEPGSLQHRHAADLKAYADYFLRESHRQLPPTQSLERWFRLNQRHLAGNPYHRQRNEVVANVLLPYFEQHPDNWAAIGFLNPGAAQAGLDFEAYLVQWFQACPDERKDVVEHVMAAFGTTPVRGATMLADAGAGAGQR
jgi:hypothetical protein